MLPELLSSSISPSSTGSSFTLVSSSAWDSSFFVNRISFTSRFASDSRFSLHATRVTIILDFSLLHRFFFHLGFFICLGFFFYFGFFFHFSRRNYPLQKLCRWPRDCTFNNLFSFILNFQILSHNI